MQDKLNQLNGKTVVVTGGCGFIGSNVAVTLAEKYGAEVILLDTRKPSFAIENYPNITWYDCDVTDVNQLELLVPENTYAMMILHGMLGTSELNSMPSRAIEINCIGTCNILELSRRRKIERLFYCTKPTFSKSKGDYENYYTMTKHFSENQAQFYKYRYGMKIAILRWLTASGGVPMIDGHVSYMGQTSYPVRKYLPTACMLARMNEDIEVFGEGSNLVDIVDVRDVAELAIRSMFDEECITTDKIYEVGTMTPLTVKQTAELIINATNRYNNEHNLPYCTSEIKHLPMRQGEVEGKDVHVIQAKDTDSLCQRLEYTLQFTAEQCLEDCVTYYNALPIEYVDKTFAILEDYDRFVKTSN